MTAHEAVLYRNPDDLLRTTVPFVRDAMRTGAPALVAAPPRTLGLLRDALGGDADRASYVDMTVVGHNPARIIPFVEQFADASAGRPVSFVGEPVWAGRSPAEVVECNWHESLLNAAFAGAPVSILCPYDASSLDPAALAEAEHTHPVVVDGAHRRPSRAFREPGEVDAVHHYPLPSPPADARAVAFDTGDLSWVRRFVREQALRAGLSTLRADDLVVALNELTTNSLLHAGEGGLLTVWHDRAERALVCEVRDSGHIRDALVGRRRPRAGQQNGRGHWLANQLCDLVRVRSTSEGTVVRLHMRRP